MTEIGLAFVVVLLAGGVCGVLSFNRLVRLRVNLKMAWRTIDMLLRQRHDELPELITACRQHMKLEQGILQQVTLARTGVADAMQRGNLAELSAAEAVLDRSLARLYTASENYPDLRTSESFLLLHSRISAFELALNDRRELYNATVATNNNTLQMFPVNLLAAWYSFKDAPLFQNEGNANVAVDHDEVMA
ncbi:hypothetical protein AB833_27235 [Chromatiales bacterium (ex Bugula neritina AB1)]|nr:hypothetical protein AB833_27235 [Chromatiales bacterium (ex Bugula neritina AB1)]